MLSLINYGSSDSEDNISDEEDVVAESKSQENGVEIQENDKKLESSTLIKLPEPVRNRAIETIEEDDDEFLQKKEKPEMKPPSIPKVRQKVKITIPKLTDFKEDDDDEDKPTVKFPTASNRKTGLLNMLPKPAHSFALPTKISVEPKVPPQQQETKQNIQSSATASNSSQEIKKVGFIPYALMDHSKKQLTEDSKKSKKKRQDSDDSDEEVPNSFFSFDSKEDDLPKVNDDEIKAMITKEANRIEERKKKAEQLEEGQYSQEDYSQYYQQQQQQETFDQEAMKALVGGSRAKRTKLDDIQIIDVSDRDVLPDKEEWLRKSLAGETSFIPTGQIDEKGPSALAKRKHQISYLSLRAEKNMAELEAMWAANRQNNREARSKYGF